jgi:methyl-accepting chemotaxis protein
VVADEVRSLAGKTGSATADIVATIEAIQEETALAIKATQGDLAKVRQGAEHTREAGQTLQKLVASAEGLQGAVHQIVALTQSIASQANGVNQHIEGIADISRDGLQASRQVAGSAADIAQRSTSLSQTVGRFRT